MVHQLAMESLTMFKRRCKLGNQFDQHQTTRGGGGHPYSLKHVQLCTNVSELETFLEGSQGKNNPTCVLANGMTLDHGPARDLLLKWGDNDNNAIIFTDSAQCWPRDTAVRDATAAPYTALSSLMLVQPGRMRPLAGPR